MYVCGRYREIRRAARYGYHTRKCSVFEIYEGLLATAVTLANVAHSTESYREIRRAARYGYHTRKCSPRNGMVPPNTPEYNCPQK